jgi:hypothetical protein
MLLNNLLTASCFVCLAQAYVVPSYPGNAAAGFRANPQDTDISALVNRDEEYTPMIHCACGSNTNSGDTQSAISNLEKMIGSSDTPRLIGDLTTTAVADSVIAFICQYDKGDFLTIDADQYRDYTVAIVSACGENVPGTYSLYGKEPVVNDRHFGYMQYSPGVEAHICDSPDSAPDTTCNPGKGPEDRALPAPATQDIRSVLDMRGEGQKTIHCQCGNTVEESSLTAASSAMQKILEKVTIADGNGNIRLTAVNGDTVAFACLYGLPQGTGIGGNSGGFNQNDWDTVYTTKVKKSCGQFGPGSYSYWFQYSGAQYGFMQYTPNMDKDTSDVVCASPNLQAPASNC